LCTIAAGCAGIDWTANHRSRVAVDERLAAPGRPPFHLPRHETLRPAEAFETHVDRVDGMKIDDHLQE
jgi:hypothetical protein